MAIQWIALVNFIAGWFSGLLSGGVLATAIIRRRRRPEFRSPAEALRWLVKHDKRI